MKTTRSLLCFNKCASLLVAFLSLSGCSSMSPEMQESLKDVRGSLPKPLRGDAIPLEEQPMPSLSGEWTDKDFPMLTLTMRQSGNKFTVDRKGERYGKQVVERIRAELNGRAIKARFVNRDPNQIRPTGGDCTGSVTKNSKIIRLTCDYGGDFFPLNFVRDD